MSKDVAAANTMSEPESPVTESPAPPVEKEASESTTKAEEENPVEDEPKEEPVKATDENPKDNDPAEPVDDKAEEAPEPQPEETPSKEPEESSPTKEPKLTAEPPLTPRSAFHTVDERTRAETHGKLRAYEARRRSAYTSKLESSSLYWRSFRDLLHASVHETARAERLVLGSAKANQAYADAMQATFEDVYLDDKGNVVTDPRRQKRLLEQRTNQEYNIASSATTSEKSAKSAELADEKRAGMLSSLVDSLAILADRFNENAKHVSTEIASELTALRAELQTQVQGIEKLGNAIVSELENSENEVVASWDSYYSMAVKVMGAGGAPVRPSPPSRGTSEDKGVSDNCSDVWVVEMQYRVAVAYQSMAWEKGSAELSKLFASMKEAECQRRVKLREVLIGFLNRQERLFLSLPAIHTPVLKDLVGRQMDRDTIEETVQLSIRKRAQSIQREESKGGKSAKNKKSGPGLSTANIADGDFKLESPLTSELLCKAKVIERKGLGMMASWKTTLAVVTSDSFLHLFDMPGTKVHSGSAPEVAFQALVPTVTVPTTDNIKAGKNASFLKGWNEHLVPSDSLVLSNCNIAMGSGSDNRALEIVETVFNTGASKVFGKVSSRKLMLRAVTAEETKDWIAILKEAQK